MRVSVWRTREVGYLGSLPAPRMWPMAGGGAHPAHMDTVLGWCLGRAGPVTHRGCVLRAHMVVVAGLRAVSLAAVDAGEGGTVHLTGRPPAASSVVLVTHEAGEGSPTALGVRGW